MLHVVGHGLKVGVTVVMIEEYRVVESVVVVVSGGRVIVVLDE